MICLYYENCLFLKWIDLPPSRPAGIWPQQNQQNPTFCFHFHMSSSHLVMMMILSFVRIEEVDSLPRMIQMKNIWWRVCWCRCLFEVNKWKKLILNVTIKRSPWLLLRLILILYFLSPSNNSVQWWFAAPASHPIFADNHPTVGVSTFLSRCCLCRHAAVAVMLRPRQVTSVVEFCQQHCKQQHQQQTMWH